LNEQASSGVLNHGAFGGVGDDLNGNVFSGPTKQDHLADEFSTDLSTDYDGKKFHVPAEQSNL